MAKKLTLQQQNFVKYYLESMNATQALIKAGYKGKHADSYASQLMSKPQIKALLSKTNELVQNQIKATFEWKVQKLEQIIEQCLYSESKDTAIKAISELNKMQGHYAPEKRENLNVNTSLDNIRKVRDEYKKEY